MTISSVSRPKYTDVCRFIDLIFPLVNVETSGVIPPEQIFLNGVDVFMDKIKDIQPLVDRVVSNETA